MSEKKTKDERAEIARVALKALQDQLGGKSIVAVVEFEESSDVCMLVDAEDRLGALYNAAFSVEEFIGAFEAAEDAEKKKDAPS